MLSSLPLQIRSSLCLVSSLFNLFLVNSPNILEFLIIFGDRASQILFSIELGYKDVGKSTLRILSPNRTPKLDEVTSPQVSARQDILLGKYYPMPSLQRPQSEENPRA